MDKEDAHYCLRCRSTIIGLDEYVAHRKSDQCQQQQQQLLQQQQQEQQQLLQQQDHQPQPSLFISQSQEDDERFSSTSFSATPADNLASEAAFMESIGLYLNTKQSLQLPRVPGKGTANKLAGFAHSSITYLKWIKELWRNLQIFGLFCHIKLFNNRQEAFCLM